MKIGIEFKPQNLWVGLYTDGVQPGVNGGSAVRLFVSGSTRTVGRLARRYPDHLGILLAPADRASAAAVTATGLPWGCDNGAYSGLDTPAFRRLLRKVQGQPHLRWIVCPDKVADAKETLRLFEQWQAEVAQAGPVAFVGQDGQEDLSLPRDRFDCLFIGGSSMPTILAATVWTALPFPAGGIGISNGHRNGSNTWNANHHSTSDHGREGGGL